MSKHYFYFTKMLNQTNLNLLKDKINEGKSETKKRSKLIRCKGKSRCKNFFFGKLKQLQVWHIKKPFLK